MESETKLEEERENDERERCRGEHTVIRAMIHSAEIKAGCGKETDRRTPGRNVTNWEKESCAKVKNRM